MFDSDYVRGWCLLVQANRRKQTVQRDPHPRMRIETAEDFNESYYSAKTLLEMFKQAHYKKPRNKT